jgi:acyl-[acyl carrier protein]--UDP-N-acetylglucosamine O-acyltransferase
MRIPYASSRKFAIGFLGTVGCVSQVRGKVPILKDKTSSHSHPATISRVELHRSSFRRASHDDVFTQAFKTVCAHANPFVEELGQNRLRALS